MANDDRTPVMLLTGFLGSGKTTLLNAWLRSPDLAGAAVIVNEFGEVGIDHALIASSNDNTIELSTGCLCCTVRGDLVDTLRELQAKRASGEVRDFDRVVIETTGLADPAPVIQALMTFPVARRFCLHRIVTAVDAVNGIQTLQRHSESLKQAAVADDVIVTKIDVPGAAVANTEAAVLALNAGARLHRSAGNDVFRFADLAAADVYDPAAKSSDVAAWLNAEAYRYGADEGHGHRHHHDVNRHDADIGSFCLSYAEPLHWEHVANWLDALVMAHGDQLLRVKGILSIAGRDKPIVVQAVQHLFHPPQELDEWPGGERRSQIVFITRALPREFVVEVLETIRQKRIAPADASF
ncbi:MAG TPA: GTP-binding protein [Pseudolabrys sp.]|nr:GTP-binding protein [Pseudolabrys sp.]